MGLDNVPRCQHIKVNGIQCGSPALRRRRYCHFHDRMLDARKRFADAYIKPQPLFSMSLLEDANSVQVAVMQVLYMLGCGQIDPKNAGLMLYGLQIASSNHITLEPKTPTDVVIDRDDVHRTSIHGPQWFEEDFEETEDTGEEGQAAQYEGDSEDETANQSENNNENKAEDEAAAAARQQGSALGDKAPSEAKQFNLDEARAEARLKIQGLVRNWASGTMAEKAGANSG